MGFEVVGIGVFLVARHDQQGLTRLKERLGRNDGVDQNQGELDCAVGVQELLFLLLCPQVLFDLDYLVYRGD